MTTDVESLADFDKILADPSSKTELIVLYFFQPNYALDHRIRCRFDIWSEDANYTDRVRFVACDKENANQDIFKKYNVEATPTFLFLKNNEQVASPYTATAVHCDDKIKSIINDVLNGKK